MFTLPHLHSQSWTPARRHAVHVQRGVVAAAVGGGKIGSLVCLSLVSVHATVYSLLCFSLGSERSLSTSLPVCAQRGGVAAVGGGRLRSMAGAQAAPVGRGALGEPAAAAAGARAAAVGRRGALHKQCSTTLAGIGACPTRGGAPCSRTGLLVCMPARLGVVSLSRPACCQPEPLPSCVPPGLTCAAPCLAPAAGCG